MRNFTATGKHMKIEEYIEHTFLKPGTLLSEVEAVCDEALTFKFRSVCVPPLFVKKARALTADTGIAVTTVVGFPLGFSAIEAKLAEIVLAIIDGADEVEIMTNTSAVKNNDWQFLASEINTVMPIIRGKGKSVTVILETGLLTGQEMITACDIYGAAGIDYMKLGSGYLEDGAIPENLRLVRKHLAAAVQIKTGAAIKNYSFAKELVNAGAGRLCCSNGVALVQQALQQN